MEKFKGCIIEESFTDNRILNEIEIIKLKITNEENPAERWHIYNTLVSEKEIEKLSKIIKKGRWYMHFWKGNDIIVIFKNKKFKIKINDKSTWKKAIDYGLSINIPKEQLDFVIGF
ncbi:MAG: hypothetical protein WC796_04845 [Candidatus Pacearchaeota archaeon]|jgi:hypothetical protein